MPASRLVSAQHGIIVWPQNAGCDTARLDVQTAILVRRSMEPTGRGAAGNIGQPIPTLGVQVTITLSEGYWVFVQRPRSFRQRGCQPDELSGSNSKRHRSGSVNRIGSASSRALLAPEGSQAGFGMFSAIFGPRVTVTTSCSFHDPTRRCTE
jgi:hypothetical protein